MERRNYSRKVAKGLRMTSTGLLDATALFATDRPDAFTVRHNKLHVGFQKRTSAYGRMGCRRPWRFPEMHPNPVGPERSYC